MKKTKWIIAATLGGLILIGCAAIGPIMSDVEQPDYRVLYQSNSSQDIEIRQYAPMIIAQVTVSGAREQAISDGFRLLAEYIFGHNTSQEDIAMTAPVQQQSSQKIAMTAPVQQTAAPGGSDNWQVSFVMPSSYTMASLPRPNNEQVTLSAIPQQQFVVITFSGSNTQENIAQHQEKLMAYIDAKDIRTVGQAKYAFYNPPWTLPALRRNEIMLQVAATTP